MLKDCWNPQSSMNMYWNTKLVGLFCVGVLSFQHYFSHVTFNSPNRIPGFPNQSLPRDYTGVFEYDNVSAVVHCFSIAFTWISVSKSIPYDWKQYHMIESNTIWFKAIPNDSKSNAILFKAIPYDSKSNTIWFKTMPYNSKQYQMIQRVMPYDSKQYHMIQSNTI